MRPRDAVLVACALASAGCASTRPTFRCPAHGGPPWRELATDHFVLRTDLGEREAGALVGRLERLRAAVAAALPDAPPGPGRVEVIAFRTPEEYAAFAPNGASGYYLRSEGGPPRVVLAGNLLGWQRALLEHELTHHFLAGALQRQPRWFAEGLASYMESLGDDAPGGTLRVGAPPPARLERARRDRVPVRELLAWRDVTGDREALLARYASSWLLVRWLAHERPEAFAEIERALATGDAPEEAWRRALPELDPATPGALEALDRELARYAWSDLHADARTVEAPAVVGFFEQRVPPAEVHAIRLALWGYGPRKGEPALRAEVAETLAEDPAHPIALQYRAALAGEDPVALARRSVSAHPDDPRAWTFLGQALAAARAAPAERVAAFRRASELAPENPAALHNLAIELLDQGRSGEALPLARHAAQLAPWSPPLLAGYAAVLSDLGQCAAAIPVQRRALDALAETAPAEAHAALGARLDTYERQCRVATEPAPSP